MDTPKPLADAATELRWSQDARLRALDAALFWEGRVNRSDLTRRFGISVPQATNDLKRYLALAPANARYDTRLKTYVADAAFTPLFGPPNPDGWLGSGEAAASLPVDLSPLPPRMLDPWKLRRVVAARRNAMALHVLYQSMEVPEPLWQWVVPCAMGSDGVRWHLRAYHQAAARFEDLLFPRMVEIDGERPAGAVPVDEDWNKWVAVELRPAGRLSPGQRAVVAADYAMTNEARRVEVRAAMLFVFLQRLGTERPGALVEVANRAAVNAELARINARFEPGRAARAAGKRTRR
jgi:hypothetical protein